MADGRLLAAASFIRPGAYLADIGTDHAYLPIYLLQKGQITRAIAADIGAGPLARARAHIAACGLSDKIETVQTDGLTGLSGRGVTDIAICGMGGELIRDILDAAPFVRDGGIRLVLQPMTRAAALRRYLAAHGFAITAEKPCRAAGRVYSCLCAVYDGQARTVTPLVAEVGDPLLETEEARACFAELVERKAEALHKACAARKSAGLSDPAEEELLADLYRLIERMR